MENEEELETLEEVEPEFGEEIDEEIVSQPSEVVKQPTPRQKVDQFIDEKGSQALQKMGVPKGAANQAIKKNGGTFSPTNMPANKIAKNTSRNMLAKTPMFQNKEEDGASRLRQALNKNDQRIPSFHNQNEEQENEGGIGKTLDKVGEKSVEKFGGAAITALSGGAISGPAADAVAKTVAKPAGKMLKYTLLVTFLPLFFIVFFAISIFIAISSGDVSDANSSTNSGNQTFCVGTTIHASDLKGLSQDEVVELLGPLAQASYMETGVLASITLGQMLEESGCGQNGTCSELSMNANNLFGMKPGYKFSRGGWDGTSTYTTSGGTVYRKYDSINDSIRDHAILLADGSPYKGLTKKTTPREQLEVVQKGGYCCGGDPSYITRIMNLINSHNLTKWDVKSNSVQSSICTTNTSTDWNIRTIAPTKNDKAFNYLKKQNVGQCVWYAQGRAIEIIQELMKKGKLDEKTGNEAIKRLGSIYGNAEAWYRKSKGLFKGSSNYKDVKPGSIISWSGGSTMCSPRCGHVAVVESVTDKEVIVTDGWANGGSSCPNNWSCVRFRSQTMSRSQFEKWVQTEGSSGKSFNGYIYFLELDS